MKQQTLFSNNSRFRDYEIRNMRNSAEPWQTINEGLTALNQISWLLGKFFKNIFNWDLRIFHLRIIGIGRIAQGSQCHYLTLFEKYKIIQNSCDGIHNNNSKKKRIALNVSFA